MLFLPVFFSPPFKFLLVVMVQVLLETGTLVTFTVARHSGDVEGIVIDRTLMTQLDGTVDKGRPFCVLGCVWVRFWLALSVLAVYIYRSLLFFLVPTCHPARPF